MLWYMLMLLGISRRDARLVEKREPPDSKINELVFDRDWCPLHSKEDTH
jgi:hypothetical protein